MRMSLTPVILCGGSGTRLWPISRKAMPKQFVPLTGERSPFVQAVERLSELGTAHPIIVTGNMHRFVVRDQLVQARSGSATILIEPEPKNTAPAILSAALVALESDPAASLLVMPSDHMIDDTPAFGRAIDAAASAALDGSLVTFGIEPTRPETGYGYLKPAQAWATHHAVELLSFVEKPSATRAQEMLSSGAYLWNAGIFVFQANALVAAFEQLLPNMLTRVKEAVAGRAHDLDFERLSARPWAGIAPDSIDYAIMEKADGLKVVAYSGGWSDLGNWDALWREAQANGSGLVELGDTVALDCANTYLRSDGNAPTVVGIGLQNVAVVATGDAVLVADKGRVQDVKQAVEKLRENGAPQADTFQRDHRPWGSYEVLASSDRFQVKRIVVRPGAALSLQSHMHRSEHWIVVSGTARVTVDDMIKLVGENEAVYVPLGAKHRLENPGKVPMTLIEVQTGSYLGEDDIVRYEDMYARS